MAFGAVNRVSKFCIKMFLALYYILKEAQAHLSRQKKIIPSMYVTIAAVREDFFPRHVKILAIRVTFNLLLLGIKCILLFKIFGSIFR